MKKSGILNREIAAVLARIGHTDTIVIADCGLPISEDVQCIDLSISLGTPSFWSVLQAILDDMEVESLTMATEVKGENDGLLEKVKSSYRNIPIEYVSHEDLKAAIPRAKAVIRTGEATPYANVVLHAGVIF
ncbi:D-ribose pyranase [Virgibacillus necropolis]|uniref:D-ribose pyranase n=1 Tax=Virgibacillus necropolis TaxID=163877 RepID=A0A221MGB7_9BACI|nr:D-ribose pyranase [Virgibacillus necropolis]ASN06674.1 D-ribose pyranase [Virgibacillus necropolis]